MLKSLLMNERSVGIIVFVEHPRRYLVLWKKKHSDFPKGHVLGGETDEQTARRETFEETGLKDIEILPGFFEPNIFSFHRAKTLVHKHVDFFLGRANTTEVTLSHEHVRFVWCTPEEAMRTVSFASHRNLIKKAEEFLKK